MKLGRVCSVPSHDIHEALLPATPHFHSVLWEHDFRSPTEAVLEAWRLRWDVLSNEFSFPSTPFIEHDDDRTLFLTHFQPVWLPTVSQGPFPASCRNRRVQFEDRIELFLGTEEEFEMQGFTIPMSALHPWPDKPWYLPPIALDPEPNLPSCVAPLSDVAVLSSKSDSNIASLPLGIAFKTTDSFHDIPNRIVREAGTQQANDGAGRQVPNPPPQFVIDIFGLPEVLALPPNYIHDHGILVRTWFLHHVHFPRWAVPRLVELDHDWSRWQHEICSSWREIIDRQATLHLHVVRPDPDRSYIPRRILADVIVSQGNEESGRFSGLVSVSQIYADGRLRSFAIAISLPEEVSGVGIAQAADILQVCQSNTCNFAFGWNRLPFSLAPVHRMQNGNGFIAHIFPRPRQSVGSSEPSQGHVAPSSARSSVGRPTVSESNNPGERQDSDGDQRSVDWAETPIPDSPSGFEDWQGVQIYRLNRPVVHCFIRWGTYNGILLQIAQFLQEHLRNLVGIHHLQATLTGLHEAEEAIILQHVSDLQLASTEQLIIIDTEIHFQARSSSIPRAPETRRNVHRVVPHLTRSHVLRLAKLANYCFLQADRCLVFFNNVLWPEQDLGVRRIEHGCYLRIVATPPLDETVSTETALNFAVSVDEYEAESTADCTMRPRSQTSLALFQTESRVQIASAAIPSCVVGGYGTAITSMLDSSADVQALDLACPKQRGLRSKGELDSAAKWFDQLQFAFDQSAFVECDDEGFVAYITTWFIDHDIFPRCAVSRPVRLTAETASWRSEILEQWRDLVDPFGTPVLHVVRPDPPATATESTLAHVLIEQNQQPDVLAAGVISVIRQESRHASLTHIAVSMPSRLTATDVVSAVKLTDLCVIRACQVKCGNVPLWPQVLEDFGSGFGITVHVRTNTDEPVPPSLWTPEMAAVMDAVDFQDDDISFVQTAAATHEESTYQQPHECKPGNFLEPEEFPMTFLGNGPLRPPRPRHDGEADWTLDLGEIFRLFGETAVWEQETFIHVSTWYIHHGRKTRCYRPRLVRLIGNPVTWIDDLRRVWIDEMDPSSNFAIHVVKPRPPQFQSQLTVCHILLEQARPPNFAAVVLSALFAGPASDGIIQGAYSVPIRMSLANIIEQMEIANFCVDRRCSVVHQQITLPEGFLLEVWSGLSIRLHIDPSVQEDNEVDPGVQNHFEDLSLMQHQAAKSPVDERCTRFPPQPAHLLRSEADSFSCEQEANAEGISLLQKQANLQHTRSKVNLDLTCVYQAHEWIDSHFTLPCFDLENALHSKAHWMPASLDWIRAPWFAFEHPIDCMRIYYDGSFLPGTGHIGFAAAAFVLSGNDWLFAGAISGQDISSEKHGSYTAELKAATLASKFLFDAVKILHDVFHKVPMCELVFDSISVGYQSAGLWKAQRAVHSCHFVRSLLRLVETRFGVFCTHTFSPGHCGEPGNELVDTLAWCAAHGSPLQDWSHFFHHTRCPQFVKAMEWAWMLFTTWEGTQQEGAFRAFPARPSTAPNVAQMTRQGLSGPLEPDGIVEISLRCASSNVLTLKGHNGKKCQDAGQAVGLDGPSRLEWILQTMEAQSIHIFALQETRVRRLHRTMDHRYWLLKSPATVAGHYGLMIGLAKRLPFANEKSHQTKKDAKQHFFQDQDFTIVAAEPRLLIAKLSSQALKCIIIAAHAPHSGAQLAEIESFWKHVQECIPAYLAAWPCLLLADANCRLGGQPCARIGPWQAEGMHEKSEPFAQFVSAQDIFLPSTFEHFHHGDGGTWRHTNGMWRRNDFIGLPTAWPLCACKSWISEELDFSLMKEDHRTVCVECSFALPMEKKSLIHKPQKADLEGFSSKRLAQLAAQHRVDFTIDVHTEAITLESEVLTCHDGRVHRQKRPRKQTMSGYTWELVCLKKGWRNALHDNNRIRSQTLMAAAFAAWRFAQIGSDCRPILLGFDELLVAQDHACAWALFSFRELGRQVTLALRKDDSAFYEQLASSAAEFLDPHQVKQFWKCIRRSLPKFRDRRFGQDPVKLELLKDQWVPYLQQLEVGDIFEPQNLASRCHERQICMPIAQEVFQPDEVPSLIEVEDALRLSQPERATGLDPLPSGLFRSHAVDLATIYFPLVLKMCFWQSEPITSKGGPMAVIYKKGTGLEAANYRGIMLLPTFAKRFHALLRSRLMALLQRQRPQGQMGGFPSMQVPFGSQVLRTFGRIMDAHNISSAVVFIDLANAFHRLIRELVSPAEVEIVLNALIEEGLPAHDVAQALELPCLLQQLGAPPFLIQLLQDLHTDTWMQAPADRSTVVTRRGTRPGSPLADCVFHVLMADVVHHINAWLAEHGPLQQALHEVQVYVESVVWADDLAIPLATLEADALINSVEQALQMVHSLFASKGFILNLQKGKTSVVATFKGVGAASLRKRFQLGSNPGLTTRLGTAEEFVHFVPQYKHLGTVFTSSHEMDQEIATRIGIARSAFAQLAKPILCNRHLPTKTRLQMFRVLIETKLYFGLGAWAPPSARQLAKLQSALLYMLKRVLRLSHEEHVTCTVPEIFHRANLAAPRARLALDRLLYAQKMWAHSPEMLQHLLLP